ncbi:hypothetical protein [Bradyrhizobium australiense]|uniref:Uncharacterized protein n=1 Tax=Bradyrhizobium australiense TaxID=2721161 RepID=A0A7Y4M023_9BRAD|nr:hypothetical protein [Bradyrhizobium australiense]NOJ44415.1 hypothetical protein [Bradyrhizobium australiense]
MRNFIRIALLVCSAVAAVPIVLAGALWLWSWHAAAEAERFYRDHPLLGQMSSLQKSSTNASQDARKAWLDLVPLGTAREVAIAAIPNEGFECKTIVEPIADRQLRQRFLKARGLKDIANDTQGGKNRVDCQMTSPALVGHEHWIVDLQFNTGGLSEARVAKWNIFL